MKARHGYTLIETLVVISLVAAALTALAFAMHAIRRCDRMVRRDAAVELSMVRLAAQLRADAHQSHSARTENRGQDKPAQGVLSLSLPVGQVANLPNVGQVSNLSHEEATAEYAIGHERVDRVLRRGATVLHRETYRLPAATVGRWSVRDGGRSAMVSLLITPDPARRDGEPATEAFRVNAAVRLFRAPVATVKP